MIQTLINVLGIAGILASIVGLQTKKHQQLIVCRTTNEMAFGIQYILFGAFNEVTLPKNGFFAFYTHKKYRDTQNRYHDIF